MYGIFGRATRSPYFLSFIALLWSAPAVLSETAGRVSGIVQDPFSAVVPGAAVAIRNLDTGAVLSTTVSQDGRFHLEGLADGRYILTVSATGFETAVRGDLTVAAGRDSAVVIPLQISTAYAAVSVSERVTSGDQDVVVPERARTSDAVSLLTSTPGLDVINSGGVSSLPSIHGLADERVNILVDGMSILSACANHMNPPTSYLNPYNIRSFSVMAGITPVSRGGDSIGGTIRIDSAPPQFAAQGQGLQMHGVISAFHRTNGVVNGGHTGFSLATENFALSMSGAYVNANDYKSGLGAVVKSTLYESQNDALQLAARRGNHTVSLDVGFQRIPQQGFVNARMDMTGNQGVFANLHYTGVFSRALLDARVYYQDTRHQMNILRDKTPGMFMPMDTAGHNQGYSLEAEIPLSAKDTLRVGTEFRRFQLNDWWAPVTTTVGSMGPDPLWNVRNGRRNRFGTYGEWETRRGAAWTTLLGVRTDFVHMNTDAVAGYNMSATTTGSAAYLLDARDFNGADRRRRDVNFDLTAMARYDGSTTSTWEFGYGRKSRAPSLYERYLWVKRSAMSASMNGWFGDANGYTGNLNLRSEIAHTVSATKSWHDKARAKWEFKLTPYITQVQNYIDVDRCPVIADSSNGCTAARFNAVTGFVTLQFANHSARIYGVDGAWRAPLGGNSATGKLTLTGLLGYVHGRRTDTGGNLYQMMPLHATAAINHVRGPWSSAFEFQAVDATSNVQAVRNELKTAGYAVLNFRTGYEWHPADRASFRLDAGIDNMTNRNFLLPMGGRYWIGDKTGNSAVPAMGRSYYTGLTFQF